MTDKYNKVYNPSTVEDKWYEIWQSHKIYSALNLSDKKPYSILMPPPNVTGILHFGHVLNNTIQDLYIRWKRMQGYEVCWFPGTDHAGIATQTRVEAELRKENLTKYDLGREQFIERVWKWKELYGGIIIQQLKKLGISCDWDRTIFTMDESASNAVREVFIRLFDEGLIYRGKRIINWSPLSQTALSDEEVEFREVNEKLYTLKYYFEDQKDYLQIATVRAETIFGDVAVAVNPEDYRYKKYIGMNVIVPLVGRVVPVIADKYADPEFGTGCVKITPAHDPNDFEVGLRHNLKIINTINLDGTLNEYAGEFNGIERFEARKKIIEKLEEAGLIEKTEDYKHNVGFSQRGGEPIEPFLSDQWFVKMKPLAESAIKVVREGKIKFYPEHWVKTFEHWMENVRDWCISRQLWWGHRIPVYYTKDGQFTAAHSKNAALEKLNLPPDTELTQDSDVLDTWFSSWLWPLTTMKWLEDGKKEITEDLKKFFPTDLLVTAPDIIFFWVARMIISSMKFKNEIPFKDVYFTSTIRDGLGRKLSKSLGNSPDPLNIIARYGADAVRFTMIYLSPLGQDIRMEVDVKSQDIPSMEIGRNFANKIWNAGRFLMMKINTINSNQTSIINDRSKEDLLKKLSFADKWVLSRYNSTIEKIQDVLINYKVNEYSKLLYDFIWRDFCDWYIEILKVQLSNYENQSDAINNITFAIEIYEGILKLLHPVMPFITEEIWHLLDDNRKIENSISLEPFPTSNPSLVNVELENEFNFLQIIIEEIRRIRSLLQIPPQDKLPLFLSCKNHDLADFFKAEEPIFSFLSNSSPIIIGVEMSKPQMSVTSVVREIEIHLQLNSSIDIEKEKERIKKEIQRLEKNIIAIKQKLENEKFILNAPENIIQNERDKLDSMTGTLEKIKSNLNSLI